MATEKPDVHPRSLRQSGPAELEIVWNDEHLSRYPVRYLRLRCRCAACIDEWSGNPLLEIDTVPDDIQPVAISPVGRYAIHIAWSDGHSSGIYSFEHLRAICPCEECTAAEGEGQ